MKYIVRSEVSLMVTVAPVLLVRRIVVVVAEPVPLGAVTCSGSSSRRYISDSFVSTTSLSISFSSAAATCLSLAVSVLVT